MQRRQNHNVQVVIGNMFLDDLNIHMLAELTDHIPQPDCRVPLDNRLAVFGDPGQVVPGISSLTTIIDKPTVFPR